MTYTDRGDEPVARGAPQRQQSFPLDDLEQATPYLAAPFAAGSIGYAAMALSDAPDSAIANPYLPRAAWTARLDQVVGPRNWSMGEPTFPDYRTVGRSLTVCGATRSEVGEGTTRWRQSDNALRGCARLFGIGRYLAELPRPVIVIGPAPEEVHRSADGRLIIAGPLLARLRAGYMEGVGALAGRFGAVLAHPLDPAPHAACENPYGKLVRAAGLAAGLSEPDLANLILAMAGREAREPKRAAAVLDTLLARLPGPIAERTLVALVLPRSGGAGVTNGNGDAPRGDRARLVAVGNGNSNGHTPAGPVMVGIDFRTMRPSAPEEEAGDGR
jgi:hypothetical protein